MSGNPLILFDWGDTLMKVLDYPGPMCDWPKIMAVPGAVRVLELLSPEYTLAVATNAKDSGPEQITAALDRALPGGLIENIFCFNGLGLGKKDPGFYEKILELAGKSPEDAVMVGDELDSDVIIPARAGLHAVWLAGDKPKTDLPDRAFRIRNIVQLPGVLNVIFKKIS